MARRPARARARPGHGSDLRVNGQEDHAHPSDSVVQPAPGSTDAAICHEARRDDGNCGCPDRRSRHRCTGPGTCREHSSRSRGITRIDRTELSCRAGRMAVRDVVSERPAPPVRHRWPQRCAPRSVVRLRMQELRHPVDRTEGPALGVSTLGRRQPRLPPTQPPPVRVRTHDPARWSPARWSPSTAVGRAGPQVGHRAIPPESRVSNDHRWPWGTVFQQSSRPRRPGLRRPVLGSRPLAGPLVRLREAVSRGRDVRRG